MLSLKDLFSSSTNRSKYDLTFIAGAKFLYLTTSNHATTCKSQGNFYLVLFNMDLK